MENPTHTDNDPTIHLNDVIAKIISEKTVEDWQLDFARLKSMELIQGADGNWNYDEYMRGMYNGMVFAMSIFDGFEPKYKSSPDTWACDRTVIYPDTCDSDCGCNCQG